MSSGNPNNPFDGEMLVDGDGDDGPLLEDDDCTHALRVAFQPAGRLRTRRARTIAVNARIIYRGDPIEL
jgi:hypothetical protein